MAHDWQELTRLTGSKPLIVERLRIVESGIAVEGEFELPPLAGLTAEDQVFVAAFVRCHGSIKQMEQYFGVSYPTIKNRLNKVSEKLDFVQIESAPAGNEVLDQIERGEVSVKEALEILNKGEKS